MNKKVLSAILFSALFAGTGTFTSCIDNDEPAGIEELRGAKAELLRAKVAVEQAQASLLMAQAEVQKALAAKENAAAEINKAIAAINQAKADSINVKTEQEREELKQTIAKHEMELDSLQLKHQVIMTNLQTQLLESQYAYETALSTVAVLKEMYPLGTEEGWSLYTLQTNVENWKKAVAKADRVVKERQADYDTALIYKQYYGEIETGELEAKADTAELNLAAAKAELAEMEAWLEEDALTKDWRAEVDELKAKNDSLNKLKESLDAQATLAEYSEEYKALTKAYNEANEPVNVDSAYSYTYVDVVGKELVENTYRLYGVKDPVTGVVSSTMFDDQFEDTDDADSLAAKVTYNSIEAVADKLEEDMAYLAGFTTEAKALLDTIAAGATVDTSYVKDIKDWKEALAAYKGLDKTTDFTLLKTKAENALARMNSTHGAKAAADSLLAYYNAIEKNGAEFNTVPVATATIGADANGSSVIYYPVTMTALKTALADTTVVRSLVDGGMVNFFTQGTNTDTGTYNDAKGAAKSYTYYPNVIKKTELNAGTALAELEAASEKAFGEADLYVDLLNDNQVVVNVSGYSYLHTQPTEADVRGLEEYSNISGVTSSTNPTLGSYGKFLFTTDEANIVYAKNYKTIMANLEGAIAYWGAKLVILMDKYEAQQDAAAAALLAKNKYYYENITKVSGRADEIDDVIDDNDAIIGALDELIDVYLPAWENAQLGDYSAAADAFKTNLNNIIALKQATVRGYERALAAAKVNLELGKTTYISQFNVAESNLNKAIEDLKDAQAELDNALAEAKQALEIIAGLDAE